MTFHRHFQLLLLSSVTWISCSTVAQLVPPNALNLRITSNTTHAIPSTLYGYMWEDINHSGDGGLYAELLQNRAFQAVIPGTQNALAGWQPYNGARLTVTNKTPGVSTALPNSLQVGIPRVVRGPIGFENTGFWGIKVQAGWTYKGSFYAKSPSFTGAVTVSLKSTRGTVYATKTVQGLSKNWKKFTFDFKPTESAPDHENVFNVVLDGRAAAGATAYFGMFSLFPPTFRGRENGMRIDLAEAIAGTQPSIWRFPGGNNLEGLSIDTRWKWNETIGPLENRPGRVANWGYTNTDGLGLMEYLDWAEDLNAEPIYDVWAGIAIANYSDFPTWPVVPEEELQPYVDEALNAIEFIIGDPETSEWGKLRAKLGRKEPYQLKYVEIGNEDWFQEKSYVDYRWKAFATAISEKYPHLQLIATTQPSTALDPPYKLIDYHVYSYPAWFTSNAFMFDDYPRNGTLFFIGEYAVTSTNTTNTLGDIPSGRLAYPTLQGAVAEAAFMTGLERNSDVVFASASRSSLQHIKSYQWTPDIITYDASRLVKSTSYYVQQLFSVNRGTHVLETVPASSAAFEPLYWVASHRNDTDVIFLKVANAGSRDLVANIFLDRPTTGIGSAVSLSTPPLSPISGLFNVSNTLDEPELIVPVYNSFAIPHPGRFNYSFPATSVTVITVQLSTTTSWDPLDVLEPQLVQMFISFISAVVLAILPASSAASIPRQQGIHLAVSPKCGAYPSDTPKDINAGIGPLSSFKTIVSFGDEYTFGGANDGGKLPPPVLNHPNPRAGGRLSNGPVWVEYLASKAGATLKDYAAEDAIIDKGMWAPSVGVGPVSDFTEQANQFITLGGRPNPDDTLYVIFFGINDYEYAIKTGTTTLTHQPGGVIYTALRLLSYPTYARNILFVDNYGRGSRQPVGETYKAEVFQGVQALRRVYGANVAFADLFTIWDGVLGDSPGHAAFGYTNAGACTVDETTTVGACSDPDHSFYWLPGTPSTVTHRIVADYIVEVLEKCKA
ncbi:hypothetical protein AX16_008615 [Volvariella volvacea WC 439]|nr:hypothetical protein AX16_008615 [Volvariella volvacea WC 439]